MLQKDICISININDNEHPVAMLVQIANQFESSINVVTNNNTANCKSIMGMLATELKKGTNIKLLIDGCDEQDAADKISEYLLG